MKKLFALVLAFCLALTMLPTPAFAEGESETPVCTCDMACTAENKNSECPVCGAEGSTPGSCGKYVAPEPEKPQETEKPVTPEEQEKPTEPTPAQKVQTLINALPDAVTAENREAVEAQLDAIDAAKASLTQEERNGLNFGRYNAAIAAQNALDGQPGAQVPDSMDTSYTITFDLRGGTLPEGFVNPATTDAEGKLASLPTPTRAGYEFVSWYINDVLHDTINSNTIFKENTTLHARWGKQVETLALSLSGYGVGQTVSGLSLTSGDQDVAVDQYSVSEDEAGTNVLDGSHAFTREKTYYITVKLSPLQDIYYDVNGFTLNGVSALSFTQDGSMTVVFKLPTAGYTITFDPNYDTATPTTVTTNASGKLTSWPTPTREGYKFDGWYTEKDGGEKVSYRKVYNANTTLYAHWLKVLTKVEFSLDGYGYGEAFPNIKVGSETEGVVFPETCEYGKDFGIVTKNMNANRNDILPNGIFAANDAYYLYVEFQLKDGYTMYDGTNFTRATLNGVAAGNQNFNGNDVTAIFNLPTIYLITFDSNGGQLKDTEKTASTTNGKLTSLPTPTREGYSFDGWYTEKDGGEKVTVDKTYSENTTLYAQWQADTYTVHFDANGGEGTMADQTMTYGQTTKLTANAFTRKGYAFTGWNTQPDGKGIDYANEAEVSDLTTSGTVTLYAHWEANTYTVHFDANGGEGTMADQPMTYGQTTKLTANAFTRKGYAFTGWNTQSDGKGIDYANEAEVSNLTTSGTVTLYAHWEANTYTVRFDANGGEGTMADQSMTYDQTTKLTANAFTRKGYAFTGWNTQSDGKGIVYANEAEVSNLTTSGTVTLYAQWQANIYTVHFDANGGEGTMANQTMTCDKSEGLKANAFTLDGHIFRGWNTQPDGTGTHYADGETVQNLTTEKDTVVTLFAQWELIVNKVNLTLSGHGIDKRVDDVKITSEEPITFNGAYGSAWGIATNQKTLKTLEGKLFRADTQYYLWVIFSPEEGCTLTNLAAKDVTLDGIAALSLEDMQGSKMALFRLPVIYTITVTAGKNGSVSSDSTINAKGVIAVFEGEDVTIKITPDKDYVIYRLTVDGQSVKTAQTYTFENIQQSHTLKARFLKNGTNPKTGDSFPLVPAIAVLPLSAAALAAVVIIARKKEKN